MLRYGNRYLVSAYTSIQVINFTSKSHQTPWDLIIYSAIISPGLCFYKNKLSFPTKISSDTLLKHISSLPTN